jgi:ribose/xylose/arabinose/galactoside ABC-type transport system permease subunit
MESIKGKIGKYLKSNFVVLLLIALCIMFSLTARGFASVANLFNLLRQTSITGIASFGMAIIMISGGIDLAMGSCISVITVVTSIMVAQLQIPPAIACLLGVMSGVLVGLINGTIITFTGMPDFICTLAMQQILNGLSYTITGGLPIYGLPAGLKQLGQGYLGPIPIPVIVMVVIFIIAIILMNKTYLGRYFYAVGSNADAARLSGVSVVKIRILSHVISGFFVGISAIVMMCRITSGQPNAGTGMEMDAITACVVGGISLNGGQGKMGKIILGVLIMGVISNGLGIMGVSTYNQYICKGLLLLGVVGLDSYRAKRTKKGVVA